MLAAWRYEISLRVLKNILRASTANKCNIFQHSKRNLVSLHGHEIYPMYVTCQHQRNQLLPNYTAVLSQHVCKHSTIEMNDGIKFSYVIVKLPVPHAYFFTWVSNYGYMYPCNYNSLIRCI